MATPVTLKGRGGDDLYQFLEHAADRSYTVVEVPGEGDDTVDFSSLGQDSPVQALDWLRPSGAVTGTSLVSHPALGSVNVEATGQQLNIEYGLNVRPHLDPLMRNAQTGVPADTIGVRCEPIPFEVRFVDVGTKMTRSAVIDWGDGQKDDPAKIAAGATAVDGVVEGVHSFTELGTYTVDITLTTHAPPEVWPQGVVPWDTSATASASVEILPAVVKNDPQRPGELAAFVGGSLKDDSIQIVPYLGGMYVWMNQPPCLSWLQPTTGGHIYVFVCQGNDYVYLDSRILNDAEIYGGPGNDVLYGAAGNDKLDGHEGRDVLYGRDGNDELVGGPGIDYLYGQSGDDVLTGGDAANFYYRQLVNPTPMGGDDGDFLYGDGGNDRLNGGDGNDYLYGHAGDDILTGGPGNDVLSGDLGNDSLDAGPGDDVLYGGPGDDQLLGGEGKDYLYAHDGNDLLDGGGGDDVLLGDLGNDILIGGPEEDHLYGSSGRDILIGGLGPDLLYGDSDDDILVGGATDHDGNYGALWAIMAEWSRDDVFAMRMHRLQEGSGLNSPFILKRHATAWDDAAQDKCTDYLGQNWCVYFAPNVVAGTTITDEDETTPTVTAYSLVNDAGVSVAGQITKDTTPTLKFTFSEAVYGAAADVTVARPSGGTIAPNSITGWGTNTLVISFTTALSEQGQYTVTLNGTTSITDMVGNKLNGGVDEVRHFTLDMPPICDIMDVTPDPRTTAVSSITIVFSEAAYGFDLADLKLTRNGTNVALTAATLTTTDNMTWTLGNLGGLTGTIVAGTTTNYVLTLTAAGSGITDAAGNALTANATDAWQLQPTSFTGTANADTFRVHRRRRGRRPAHDAPVEAHPGRKPRGHVPLRRQRVSRPDAPRRSGQRHAQDHRRAGHGYVQHLPLCHLARRAGSGGECGVLFGLRPVRGRQLGDDGRRCRRRDGPEGHLVQRSGLGRPLHRLVLATDRLDGRHRDRQRLQQLGEELRPDLRRLHRRRDRRPRQPLRLQRERLFRLQDGGRQRL